MVQPNFKSLWNSKQSNNINLTDRTKKHPTSTRQAPNAPIYILPKVVRLHSSEKKKKKKRNPCDQATKRFLFIFEEEKL